MSSDSGDAGDWPIASVDPDGSMQFARGHAAKPYFPSVDANDPTGEPQVHEGQVVGREFVVARRDAPTLFDLIEEPFDQIARSLEMRTEADRLVAIASRRYVGRSAPLFDECSDPIGVVASVREQH